MEKIINKTKLFILPCNENNFRPRFLDGRILLYLTLLLVMLKFVSLFFFTFIHRTPYFADISKGALIQMTNEERGRMGLGPLSEDPRLTEAAKMKAKDMLQRDYFSHWSPDGTSPWYWVSLAGYNYQYAGENLAIGFLDAKDVHKAWIASPDHKNNILGANYSDIGIAIEEGDFYGQKTFLVVQVFGSKSDFVTSQAITPTMDESSNKDPSEDLIQEEFFAELSTENQTSGTLSEGESSEDSIEQEVIGDLSDEDSDPIKESAVLGVESIISSGNDLEISKTKQAVFNFFMLRYDDMIRQMIFYIMLFLGFVLSINVLVRFDIQHPDLVFKGLAFLILFFVFDFLDQTTLIGILTGAPWIG